MCFTYPKPEIANSFSIWIQKSTYVYCHFLWLSNSQIYRRQYLTCSLLIQRVLFQLTLSRELKPRTNSRGRSNRNIGETWLGPRDRRTAIFQTPFTTGQLLIYLNFEFFAQSFFCCENHLIRCFSVIFPGHMKECS